MAGIVAYIEDGDVTISKCKTISTTIDGGYEAGIAGISHGNINVSDCNVINSSKTNSMKLTAGITNYVAKDKSANFSNCNVQNIELNNKSKAAGILSNSASNVTIDNCNTKNLSGSGELILGYVGNNAENVSITNCSSQACEMTQCAGMIDEIYLKGKNNETSVNIENCSMKDIKIAGITSMCGGLLAECQNVKNLTISKCYAQGIEFSNVKGNSAATIIGQIEGSVANAEISDCHVDNIKITNARFAGGIVALNKADNMTIKKCSTNNLIVDNITSSTGGILAHSYNTPMTIQDCIVANFDATKGQNFSLSKIGGAIGFGGDENTNITIEGVKVSNSKLGTGNGSVGYLTIGGIGGMIPTKEVNNCHVKDVEINSKNVVAVGGILGVARSEISMTKNSVNNFKVSCDESGRECKQVGGIIGQSHGNATISESIVNDFTVEHDSTSRRCEFAAGVVGLGIQQVTLDKVNVNHLKLESGACTSGMIAYAPNVNVTNSKVYGASLYMHYNDSYYRKVGGVIGFTGVGTSNIDNVTVENIVIESNVPASGIVGFCDNIIISNSNVNSSEIKANVDTANSQGASVGGVIGFANTSNIDNVKVDHVGIECNVRVGGILGFGNDINIINSSVDWSGIKVNATIRSTYAGGITGYAPSKCRIESCSLYGTEILLTGDGEEASVGGVVGHGNNYLTSTALITKCNLESCKFQGTNGVGGIAGVAVSNISDCHTKNTYVEGTVGNIGGILGYGGATSYINSTTGEEKVDRKAVSITNCSIEDGYLDGPNAGNIIGKNSHMTSTPNATEDVIENCTFQPKVIE